jgi:hypothetical protein
VFVIDGGGSGIEPMAAMAV